VHVIRVLEQIIPERGTPQRIRTDNQRIELLHIRPGKPAKICACGELPHRLREQCLQVRVPQSIRRSAPD
jgi:hypothetical protein